tara:strand:- start:548 stop:700 length:153 start_codon:yes stop_codon:yes gene_type:complete
MARKAQKRKTYTASKSKKITGRGKKKKPDFSRRDILKFIQELRNKNDSEE